MTQQQLEHEASSSSSPSATAAGTSTVSALEHALRNQQRDFTSNNKQQHQESQKKQSSPRHDPLPKISESEFAKLSPERRARLLDKVQKFKENAHTLALSEHYSSPHSFSSQRRLRNSLAGHALVDSASPHSPGPGDYHQHSDHDANNNNKNKNIADNNSNKSSPRQRRLVHGHLQSMNSWSMPASRFADDCIARKSVPGPGAYDLTNSNNKTREGSTIAKSNTNYQMTKSRHHEQTLHVPVNRPWADKEVEKTKGDNKKKEDTTATATTTTTTTTTTTQRITAPVLKSSMSGFSMSFRPLEEIASSPPVRRKNNLTLEQTPGPGAYSATPFDQRKGSVRIVPLVVDQEVLQKTLMMNQRNKKKKKKTEVVDGDQQKGGDEKKRSRRNKKKKVGQKEVKEEKNTTSV